MRYFAALLLLAITACSVIYMPGSSPSLHTTGISNPACVVHCVSSTSSDGGQAVAKEITEVKPKAAIVASPTLSEQ